MATCGDAYAVNGGLPLPPRFAKRNLYAGDASLFEAQHIWLASNRTTLSVCTVCMAARKEPILF
jgi:hypothetical protein